MANNKPSPLYYILISLLAGLFLLPMLWMLSSGFKTEANIYNDMSSLWAFLPRPSSFTTDSYTELLSMYSVGRNMFNSLIYASITVLVGLTVNSLAGYSLAKFNFPLKNFWLMFIIALMIVPIEAIILPMFLVVNRLGINNTIAGLLFPFFVNVMNIFLFRQFFTSFPSELSEAARIDGMSHIALFFKIVAPISVGIYVTVGVLTFLASWNDFLWPVMALSKQELMPIQVALTAIFSDRDNIFMGHTMAALTLATIPVVIIYVFFQRHIVEGVARSGIK